MSSTPNFSGPQWYTFADDDSLRLRAFYAMATLPYHLPIVEHCTALMGDRHESCHSPLQILVGDVGVTTIYCSANSIVTSTHLHSFMEQLHGVARPASRLSETCHQLASSREFCSRVSATPLTCVVNYMQNYIQTRSVAHL